MLTMEVISKARGAGRNAPAWSCALQDYIPACMRPSASSASSSCCLGSPASLHLRGSGALLWPRAGVEVKGMKSALFRVCQAVGFLHSGHFCLCKGGPYRVCGPGRAAWGRSEARAFHRNSSCSSCIDMLQ